MSIGESVARRVGQAMRDRHARSSYADAPALAVPSTIALTSPRFADGEPIPVRHSGRGRGENVSPALAWSGLPDGTRQLLLVMEDPDVPMPRPMLHLVALLEPPAAGSSGGVPDGALAADAPAPGVRFVPLLLGRTGYHGPRPLAGHGPHHYGFHLYALDTRVPDELAPAKLPDLLPVLTGHVLAAGHLVGVQEYA